MCGIAGFSIPPGSSSAAATEHRHALARMVRSLRHRGPDALRGVVTDGMALGHARLSIVDLEGGSQPMTDPETGVTVVFNGEIFNHVELRDRYRDHRFRTRSDTEVILAGFLDEGMACVERFIGQFAFALWDPRDKTLWMSRDRVGIRPLFYAFTDDGIAFASEAKALFAAGLVEPSLDKRALKQTLQLWTPVSGRSAFEGVHALPPATVARFKDGELRRETYWTLDLSDEACADSPESLTPELQDEVEALLVDAVRLRLRADVPVAAYLSGGLDSSLICGITQEELGGTLRTFSVAFANTSYDEREYQQEVTAALATAHKMVEVDEANIGSLLPDVVFHGEQSLIRAAPAPFLRLSRLVHEDDIKVVLTGEGADEVFLGYDLYRETKVRQFWARHPDSAMRPRLLKRLYPYLELGRQGVDLLRKVYGVGLEDPGAVGFSHLIRWNTTGRIARFYAPGFREETAAEDPVASLLASLPPEVAGWRPLARAQHLEMTTLLANYLMSAQGDRMLMGNSVEGRFPFLDHRVIELAARLKDSIKLRSLDEKHVLKRVSERWVPERVRQRPKFPYRAPIAGALAAADGPEWMREKLSRDEVDRLGVFDSAKVEKLTTKLRARPEHVSEADNMALVAIATTQLLASTFVNERAWERGEDLETVPVEVMGP
jgi:asparagine synthase (glutamine-hydrolysing)